MHLGYDTYLLMSQTIYSYIHLFIVHEFCCDYNIIVCWVKSDIYVLVLICPYLVLDSVLYLLCYYTPATKL